MANGYLMNWTMRNLRMSYCNPNHWSLCLNQTDRWDLLRRKIQKLLSFAMLRNENKSFRTCKSLFSVYLTKIFVFFHDKMTFYLSIKDKFLGKFQGGRNSNGCVCLFVLAVLVAAETMKSALEHRKIDYFFKTFFPHCVNWLASWCYFVRHLK